MPRLLALLVLAGCTPVAPVAPLPPDDQPPGRLGDADAIRYVVHVSVDGLRPDAVTGRPADELPAFARLRLEGAFTHNARTDAGFRNTLPNHATQLTGRPVAGDGGHGWTLNADPEPGATLHSNAGAYVASVFDVVHDAGLATAAYISKSKLSLFDASYDGAHGAPDATGADDGRDKLDVFDVDASTGTLVRRVVADLRSDPAAYTFVHLRDPDATGHAHGWSLRPTSRYLRAVQRADDRIGRVLAAIEADPRLRGRTAVVVTADHGGSGRDHQSERAEHFTVPFYVWGPGISPADLYALNAETRADPGTENVGYDAGRQPVRNGDAANLALALLGLGPVPGSTIGAEHPLRVRAPAPESAPARSASGAGR